MVDARSLQSILRELLQSGVERLCGDPPQLFALPEHRYFPTLFQGVSRRRLHGCDRGCFHASGDEPKAYVLDLAQPGCIGFCCSCS